MPYTIQQVAEITGLPASTLRFYEAEGLLPPVDRNKANRRVYSDAAMDWLSIVTCLKNTGMPILEIRRFVELCRQGDATLTERYRIVQAHRQATQARIAQLQNELEHINAKVAYYQAACEAGTEAALKKSAKTASPQSTDKNFCGFPQGLPQNLPQALPDRRK